MDIKSVLIEKIVKKSPWTSEYGKPLVYDYTKEKLADKTELELLAIYEKLLDPPYVDNSSWDNYGKTGYPEMGS